MTAETPKDEPEPTQETPEGATIPVPTREDSFRDLEKVAKPREEDEDEPEE